MRYFSRIVAVAAAVLVGGRLDAAESVTPPIGKPVAAFSLPDVHGKLHTLDELRDNKPLVIAVLGTECPLAKVYAPRLETLSAEYGAKGVKFVAIDANLQDSLTEIAAFVRSCNLTFPMLKDLNNKVADSLGATRTPEVFLLDAQGALRYAGRIDDQYGFKTGAGYAKPRLARRDLAVAIDEVLAGSPVSQPLVKADGCLIGRVKHEPRGEVTYSNQIARILQNRCQECHRSGEVAPFAMDSYDEIVGWAETINEVVEEGRMPPWFASAHHGKYSNDARLSDEEKQLIAAWVDNGCPEGDKAQLPPPREYVTGWKIGEPDQVIYIADEAHKVPAEGVVEYTYFTVDPGWKEDKWVEAVESRPGTPAVVHHIIAFVLKPGSSDAMMSGLGGYAPGNGALIHPAGTAKFVPAGSKLLFQMHYTPNGTATTDRSYIGVKFADPKNVKKLIHDDMVGNLSLKIPPNDPNYEISSKHKFRRDMLLLNVTPHMHLRGKDFTYLLEYPDGHKDVLLEVPRWDFNWQLRYEFAEPILAPKGSTLRCIAHYDNSPENLANPDPTATVRFGDQTWEEMMFGFYSALDPNEDLTAKVAAKPSAGKDKQDADNDGETTLEGDGDEE